MKEQEQEIQLIRSVTPPSSYESNVSTTKTEPSLIVQPMKEVRKQTQDIEEDDDISFKLVPLYLEEEDKEKIDRTMTNVPGIKQKHIIFKKTGVIQNNNLKSMDFQQNDLLANNLIEVNDTKIKEPSRIANIYVRKKLLNQPQMSSPNRPNSLHFLGKKSNVKDNKDNKDNKKERQHAVRLQKNKQDIHLFSENSTITFRMTNDSHKNKDTDTVKQIEINHSVTETSIDKTVQIMGIERSDSLFKEHINNLIKIQERYSQLVKYPVCKTRNRKKIKAKINIAELVQKSIQLKLKMKNRPLYVPDDKNTKTDNNGNIKAIIENIHLRKDINIYRPIVRPTINNGNTPIFKKNCMNYSFQTKHPKLDLIDSNITKLSLKLRNLNQTPPAKRTTGQTTPTTERTTNTNTKTNSNINFSNTKRNEINDHLLTEECIFSKRFKNLYHSKPAIRDDYIRNSYNCSNYYYREPVRNIGNLRNITEVEYNKTPSKVQHHNHKGINYDLKSIPLHYDYSNNRLNFKNRISYDNIDNHLSDISFNDKEMHSFYHFNAKSLLTASSNKPMGFYKYDSPIVVKKNEQTQFNTCNFKTDIKNTNYSKLINHDQKYINQIDYSNESFLSNFFTNTSQINMYKQQKCKFINTQLFNKECQCHKNSDQEYHNKTQLMHEIYRKAFETPDYRLYEKRRGLSTNTSMSSIRKVNTVKKLISI